MGIGMPLSASGRRKRRHAGKLNLNLKRRRSFRDAAFMGIMRWVFYSRLNEEYADAGTAYGYTDLQSNVPALELDSGFSYYALR
jgi:hypothetical protein